MKNIVSILAALCLSVAVSAPVAASIDTSSYDNSVELLTSVPGAVIEGAGLFDGGDLGVAGTLDEYYVTVSAFDPLYDPLTPIDYLADPLSFEFQYGGTDLDSLADNLTVFGASEIEITASVMEFLFEVSADLAYLVVFEQIVSSTDPLFVDFTFNDTYVADITVTLTELTNNTTVIPLPATLPMLLGALGLFAVVRRHI